MVVSACGFQVAVLVWSWGLCVRFAGCCSTLQTGHTTLSSTPEQQLENHSTKYHRQKLPYITLELLMMGTVVPETCWASNKTCNKNLHPANRTHNPQLHTRTATWKPQHEIPQAETTVYYSWAPDDGHSGARNMLSKQ